MGCTFRGALVWRVLCHLSILFGAHAVVEEELRWQAKADFWNMTVSPPVMNNALPKPVDYLMHLTTQKANYLNRMRKGRLKSPILSSSPGCKVEVEKELRGSTTHMSVKQVQAERGFPVRQLVMRGSDASGDQKQRQLKLYYPEPTIVLIEGTVQGNGTLLLRSASFDSSCHFHEAQSSSLCNDDEYNCYFTSICITHNKVCNFVTDCPQGDDEAQCGITDFENGMAGWHESRFYDPPYIWRWTAAEDATYPGGTAPDHDHTLGTTGHFMWAPGVSSVESSATAVAEAPMVGPVVTSCTVSFWYQRKGDTPGLRFIVNTEGPYSTSDIQLSVTNSLEWNERKFEVGANEKISLEFISNWHKEDNQYNDVCIDDIDMLFCSPDTPPFEDEIKCDFNDEYDVCRLYQSHDDDADWYLSYYYLYPHDHYMQTRSFAGNQTLQTWWYSKDNIFCVSFSYKLDGWTDLRVILVKEDMEEELWRREGPLLAWRTQHFQLTSSTIFQIHFRSRNADDELAYLDNVFLLDGTCPVSLTCTFDDGDECPLESFTDGTSTLTWTLGSGNTTSNDAPQNDHTWKTSMGHYLYLPLQPHEEGQRAYVKSHSISTTTNPEGDCLQFWYYLYSERQSSPVGEMAVRLLLKDNTVTDRIWERSYDQHPEWQLGEVTIKNGDFCILFEGLRKNGTNGSLAWDDITIGRGKCGTPGDCTFERGTCGWEDQQHNDYTLNYWEWVKAIYVPTGPGVDHTILSSQGHYVIYFVDTCSNDRCSAHLDSMEIIAEENVYCLNFYISVLQFGENNYLAVDVVNVDENLSQNKLIIKESDEQQWTQHSFLLSDIPHLFRVRFRGENLPLLIGGTAYIAIDDIHLTPGLCQDASTQYPFSTPSPDSTHTCNFEGNSVCGWNQDTEDDRDWHWTTGETIDSGASFGGDRLGPLTDHTTGLSSGHFLYVTNKAYEGDTARLISQPIPKDTPHCFSFSYYIHGTYTPTLNVYIVEDGPKLVPDWSAAGEEGEFWQLMRIFISNQTKVTPHIVIEAYQELEMTEDTSHVALDDFVLQDRSCSNAGFGINCDFEAADLCEYVIFNVEGDGGWTRVEAMNNLPGTDHTYNSAAGHYLFMDFTPGNMTTSLVASPFLPKFEENMCVKWYYYFDVPDNITASLRVYLRSSGAKQFSAADEAGYWEVHEPEGPNWHLGEMDVQGYGNMYVEFQGRIKSLFTSTVIAIDDVSTMEKVCPAPATCSFESGMCGWHDAGLNEAMPWLMNTGPTPTPNTGPSVDHTLGSLYGHYMYISASSGYEGARTELVSELIPSGEYCFEFYYYMSGMSMGALVVYMNTAEGEKFQVFNRTGNQGEKWKLAQVSIAEITDFSIGIEGIVGFWVESDIAIDDIWTYVGVCEEMPSQYLCVDGTPIPEEKVCDFIVDCSAGDDENECGTCNFEFGLCGWKSLNSSSYVWTVGMNMSDSENDGDIVYDHTIGTEEGHFLYVTEEPSNERGPAMLLSSFHRNTQVECVMIFWYREKSNEIIGRNIIITVSVKRDEDITPVAYTVNKQNDDWQYEEVRLQDWQGSFEILIEASTTGSYSDLTVDDVSFMKCGLLQEAADCLDNQFKCHETGVCVNAVVMCDNTNDCGDKSDELDCELYDPVCTFEDEQPCYWTQELEQDDIDWRLGSGPTPAGEYSFMTGPPVDHTTRLNTGRYMYITQEPSKEVKMKRAWLISPVLQASRDDTCVLRLHYYMYGKNVHSLNVYQTLTKHGPKQLIFSKNGELGQFWNRAVVYSSTQQLFQIIVEGITNSDDYSDIAIDDLSFIGCVILNVTLPTGTTSLPPTDPCNDNEFYCNVGKECVSLSLRCNWQVDCSNGADEDECGDCDFEYGMCSWYDDSDGTFQWKRLRAGDMSAYDHPNVDHTFANNSGHILYVEGSGGVAGKTAVLKSPTILQKGGPYCQLHFWVYQRMAMNVKLMIFLDSDTLHLQTDDFATTGPREEIWYNVILPVPNMEINYHFTIEATPVFDEASAWADSHSILAIDDLEYFDCNSDNNSLDCTFDDVSDHHGFCMWRASADCQHYWKHSARFPGDISDHTTGQSFYMYVDFSDNFAVQGDYARLESSVQLNSSSKGHIFSLWYYMNGENVGTFKIIQRTKHDQINNTYLDLSGPQDYRWNLFSTVLDINTYFSIVLEAEWGEVGEGILAVDDIVMKSDTDMQVCDFQIDFCQWTSQPGNTSWERSRGKDHAVGCPPLDHSDNSEMGYYAYLVPTEREGDSAYLYSPTFENVGSQCLRIWYYLDTSDAGHIEIMVRDVRTAEIDHIMTLNSSTYSMWALGLGTISSRDIFSVIIEGTTGIIFGNAAIDDLELIQGMCPDLYECDFEYDICNWNNDETQDSFDWQRSSGREGGGIMVDHTINYETGHYMVARVANKKAGDSAKLTGGIVPAARDCITFWYSMQNLNGVTLTILLNEDSNDVPITGFQNSSQGQLWDQVKLKHVIMSDVFRVSFQVYVLQDQGPSELDSVGIDDIAFTTDCNVATPPPYQTTPHPTHMPTIFDCDFEQESARFCAWDPELSVGIDWTIGKGDTPTEGTGPHTDHTFLTGEGHYIFVSPVAQHNRSARLSSPVVSSGKEGACISFWYHMHGPNIGRLQVLLSTPDNMTVTSIWQRTHEQGRDWMQAKLYIGYERSGSQVIIEATPYFEGMGDIALDDITLDFKECSSSLLCDFESGMCSFKQSVIDELDWKLVSKISPDSDSEFLPLADHSQQTTVGHYLKLEGEGSGILFTEKYHPDHKCVQFWYFSNGPADSDHSALNVYLYSSDQETPLLLLTVNDTLSCEWMLYRLKLNTAFYYSVAFQGDVHNGSVFGLDDVQPLTTCEPWTECTFETDFCIWKNPDGDDDMDWSLITASHLTSSYGPKVDVTLGSPYAGFVYFEPPVSGGKAILETYNLGPGIWCLNFWTHLQSLGRVSLSIVLEDINSEAIKILWENHEIIHADWKFEQVLVNVTTSWQKVFFLADSSVLSAGIIALDQISVNQGHCSNVTVPECDVVCDVGSCVTQQQMCNFVHDCTQGQDENFCGYNCTFEHAEDDHCTWNSISEATNGELSWILVQAQNSNDTIGPSIDHTLLTNQGHYAALVPKTLVGADAPGELLRSPALYNSAAECRLTFWYVLYELPSTDRGFLRVSYNTSDVITLLLDIIPTERKEWMYGVAYIGRIRTRFSLFFEGKRNLMIDGNTAIDDIKFEKCFLPSVNQTNCQQFTCSNSACVSTFDKCDFVDNCGDYSDEDDTLALCSMYGGRCNFEDGSFCSWESQDGEWQLGSPSSKSSFPSRDHTLNSASGSYIYIEITENSNASKQARLTSPVFFSSSVLCHLRFYYFMDGPAVDKLIISSKDSSNGPLEVLEVIPDPIGQLWERAEVIPTVQKVQQVVITGSLSSDTTGMPSVIAIDDISFTSECTLSESTLPTIIYPISTTTKDYCENEYTCLNEKCIPFTNVCDFKNDCGDNTDEKLCAECDFESDQCGWEDKSFGKNKWQRVSGVPYGREQFVMKVIGDGSGVEEKADLISVPLGASSASCLMTFYYYLYSTDSVLELSILTENTEFVIWSASGGSDMWTQMTVGIMKRDSNWQLQYRVNKLATNALIMIDDIIFQNCAVALPQSCRDDQFSCDNGNCINSTQICDFSNDCGDNTDESAFTCQTYTERCNFETDFCNWEQDQHDDLDFIRKSGETLSEGVGPDYDHTYGNESGYYMYLQSVEGIEGKNARIMSPSLMPSDGSCHFRFWYIIREGKNASLSVCLQESSPMKLIEKESMTRASFNDNLLWIKDDICIFQSRGTNSYLWTSVDLAITYTRFFKIIVEAWTGKEIIGDISIDDTSFSPECHRSECMNDEFQCNDKTRCIPQEKLCDFQFDCSDKSDEEECFTTCSFEDNQCGWREGDSDGYNWIRAKAGDAVSGTDQTGPFTDQSGNEDGHFLLLHGTNSELEGQVGQTFSHWYQNSNSECLFVFWYYMNDDLGSYVILRLNSSQEDFIHLSFFDKMSVTSNVWTFYSTGVGRRKDPFQFSLYSVKTEGVSGVFAVDETSFQYCGFTETECTTSTYYCTTTERCIYKNALCDLVDDCGDGEDETADICSLFFRTTLENEGELGWFTQGQDGEEDNTEWLLGTGDSTSIDKAPNFDHTQWSRAGHYLYMDVPLMESQTARLVSRFIQAGPECSFTFYFNMFQGKFGTLSILFRTLDGSTSVFSEITPPYNPLLYNVWQKRFISGEAMPQDQYFQIILEGTSQMEHTGTIALDDFVFHLDCSIYNISTVSPPPLTNNCTGEEFQCSDGSCVPLSKKCNFVSDCPNYDSSDEDGCVSTNCTFEGEDLCGWTIEATDIPVRVNTLQETRYWNATKMNEEKIIRFTWQVSNGSSPADTLVQAYKPKEDHTTGTSSGCYIYAHSEAGNFEASTDLATKFYFGKTSKTCRLAFWYWWSGPEDGSLHVLIRPRQESPYEVWVTDGNQGNAWQLAEVGVGDLDQCALSIEAKRGMMYEGGGAIDDVNFLDCLPPTFPPEGFSCEELGMYGCTDGNCIKEVAVCDYSYDCFDESDEAPELCRLYTYRCSFEAGFTGDWEQDVDDNTQWVLRQGTSGHGLEMFPEFDHTQGSSVGHYVVMDVEMASDPDVVSRLHSPVILGSVSGCQLRFWYQATGIQHGLLRIYRRTSYYSDGSVLLATISDDARNIWLKYTIDVDREDLAVEDYQVVIEGVSPAGRDGFIVLDDLSMTPSCERSSNQELPGGSQVTTPQPACFPGQLMCLNDNCYNPVETCNFIDDCGDNTDERFCSKSCDFETEDKCGWFENSGSSAHWERFSFPAEPPGPSSDHYNEKTSHALKTVSERSPGRVAILESAKFSTVGTGCTIRFYHFQNGTGTEGVTLRLFIKAADVDNDDHATIIWSETSYSAKWKHESIGIGGERNFILYFEVVHSDGTSFVALDDIEFIGCIPTGECHSVLDYQCADGSCIPYQYACDSKYDCRDKSDEYMCTKLKGDCNFDQENWNEECGWIQSQDDDKDWERASTSGYLSLGPNEDHTLGSKGYYLYMKNQQEPPGRIASIRTGSLYAASYDICYVRFWYYSHNDDAEADTGSLRLFMEVEDGHRYLLLTRSGNYMKKWLEELVPVSSNSSYFLVFEAETGGPSQTYIALDDFSVTPACVTGTVPPPSNRSCETGEASCDNGECIPEGFFCDCFVDCTDGSDEDSCLPCSTIGTRPPTTTTTPIPSPCEDTEIFCDDEESTCLPALLMCDGLVDCSNGADEENCPDTMCDDGYVYCGDTHMQPPCMSLDNLCDGQPFCLTHNADESMCGICPSNYCLNNGVCEVSGNNLPQCRCKEDYSGFRCMTYAGPPGQNTGLTGGQIAGIVIGVMLAATLCGFMIFVYFTRGRRRSLERRQSQGSLASRDDNDATFGRREAEEAYVLENINSSHESDIYIYDAGLYG